MTDPKKHLEELFELMSMLQEDTVMMMVLADISIADVSKMKGSERGVIKKRRLEVREIAARKLGYELPVIVSDENEKLPVEDAIIQMEDLVREDVAMIMALTGTVGGMIKSLMRPRATMDKPKAMSATAEETGSSKAEVDEMASKMFSVFTNPDRNFRDIRLAVREAAIKHLGYIPDMVKVLHGG
jgi:hypothetical protein